MMVSNKNLPFQGSMFRSQPLFFGGGCTSTRVIWDDNVGGRQLYEVVGLLARERFEYVEWGAGHLCELYSDAA